MARPKIKNKKKNISLSINIELVEKLEEYLSKKGITKSEYLEYLIKKEIKN